MMNMKINAGACSRAGLRTYNNDAYAMWPRESLINTPTFWAVISDGAGDDRDVLDVSRSAVKLALQSVTQQQQTSSPRVQLTKTVNTINQWLRGAYKQHIATLTLIEIQNGKIVIAHVGDTRLYRLRDGELRCLTHDHRSVAADMGGGLTKALGLSDNIEPDITQFPVAPHDRFALLSDGVFESLTRQQLQRFLQEGREAQRTADDLVTQAIANGSSDNATAIIFDVIELDIAEASPHSLSPDLLPLLPPPEVGDTVDDYFIEAVIATTRTNVVYRALDKQNSKSYALKFAKKRGDFVDVSRANLLHEITVGAGIRVPLCVSAHALNRQRQSGIYAVFDYVKGKTLQANDARRYGFSQLLKIGVELAERLHCLHQLSMVHNDVKPENIMRGDDNQLYLIDFSLARNTSDALTNVGGGTPNYMAPELWQDAAPSPLSDQFSLAATLYCLASGGLSPYGDMEMFSTPSFKHYRPLREQRHDLPVWFEMVLLKALHCDPLQRFADCRAFADALAEGQQHGLGLTDRRRHTSLLERNPLRFYQTLSLMLAALCIVLLFLQWHP